MTTITAAGNRTRLTRAGVAEPGQNGSTPSHRRRRSCQPLMQRSPRRARSCGNSLAGADSKGDDRGMSIYDHVPWTLSWGDADPRQHAFDATEARAIIAGMTPELLGWQAPQAWEEAVTVALAVRFGRWAYGWAWGRDESDLGGGPVGSW